MEIDLKELKVSIDTIFDHLIKTRKIEKVELGKSLYWNISSDQAYDMNSDPNDIGVGNLNDDWEFVSKLLAGANQPVAYQLTEVAPLLRRLGEVLGDQLAKDGG